MALLLPALPAQAQPLSIRFGHNVSSPYGAFVVAVGTDAFAREGMQLRLEAFQDTAATRDALIARQVDLAGMGFATALQVIGLGLPLKIVGGLEYTFTDKSGHPWEAIFVITRKDRNIASLQALEGRKVAVDSFASPWFFSLQERLKEVGIDPKGVTALAMPFTQMAGALVAGEVDAAVITSTEYVRVNQRVPVDVLLTGSQLTTLPLDLTSVIVGREDWIRNNEAAVVRFMRTMLKTRLFMREDIAEHNGATIRSVVARDLKFDEFLTDTFYNYRAGYSGRELDFINWLQVPRAAVATHGRMLASNGLLKGKPAPTYDQAVDMRFVRKAFEEVGEPWDERKADN